MIVPIPPLMEVVPAVLSLGIQVAASIVGFVAVLSMIMDSFVQPCFRPLDRVLALRAIIIGVHERYCNKPRQCCRQNCRYCCFSYSLNQGFPPSCAALARQTQPNSRKL